MVEWMNENFGNGAENKLVPAFVPVKLGPYLGEVSLFLTNEQSNSCQINGWKI